MCLNTVTHTCLSLDRRCWYTYNRGERVFNRADTLYTPLNCGVKLKYRLRLFARSLGTHTVDKCIVGNREVIECMFFVVVLSGACLLLYSCIIIKFQVSATGHTNHVIYYNTVI